MVMLHHSFVFPSCGTVALGVAMRGDSTKIYGFRTFHLFDIQRFCMDKCMHFPISIGILGALVSLDARGVFNHVLYISPSLQASLAFTKLQY